MENTPLLRSVIERPFYYKFLKEENRKVRLYLDPFHPRFSFSLSQEVKRHLQTEEERLVVCEILMRFREDALDCWPSDPLKVTIDAGTFYLSDHPHPEKSGKVRVVMLRDLEADSED